MPLAQCMPICNKNIISCGIATFSVIKMSTKDISLLVLLKIGNRSVKGITKMSSSQKSEDPPLPNYIKELHSCKLGQFYSIQRGQVKTFGTTYLFSIFLKTPYVFYSLLVSDHSFYTVHAVVFFIFMSKIITRLF